jgi:hypothetical protein
MVLIRDQRGPSRTPVQIIVCHCRSPQVFLHNTLFSVDVTGTTTVSFFVGVTHCLEMFMEKPKPLSFTSSRRFGIELEVNSFDGESRPPKGKRPEGIEYVAALVGGAVPDVGAEIRGYEHSCDNKWIIKPDSSCGMEVVSPPSKGWQGLRKALQVADALAKDPKIKVDKRCSVHVHVDVSDLSEAQLASVVSWYVKCEPVFLDAMPPERKRNRYCQFIGMTNNFRHDQPYTDRDIIARCGDVKYYSMNTLNWVNGTRKTVEFRPIEGAGVKDPYLIKNWVRMLIHFVETTAAMRRPMEYHKPANEEERSHLTPWTSLCWLDPEHVLSLLGFNNVPVTIPGQDISNQEYSLSNGLMQTRNWFISRLHKNMSRHTQGGLRYFAAQQLDAIMERFKAQNQEIVPEKHLSPKEQLEEQLFGEDFKF